MPSQNLIPVSIFYQKAFLIIFNQKVYDVVLVDT